MGADSSPGLRFEFPAASLACCCTLAVPGGLGEALSVWYLVCMGWLSGCSSCLSQGTWDKPQVPLQNHTCHQQGISHLLLQSLWWVDQPLVQTEKAVRKGAVKGVWGRWADGAARGLSRGEHFRESVFLHSTQQVLRDRKSLADQAWDCGCCGPPC